MQTRRFGLLCIAPALLVVLVTAAYPLVSALITSFRDWKLNESFDPGPFTGFDNYTRVFTDPVFLNSVVVTTIYTVVAVTLGVGGGLLLALLLRRPGRFSTFTKTMLILPFAVAPALKGFSWRFMLDPQYGVYDLMISKVLPFTDGILWLADPFWAILVIAMSEIWGWAPFIALMFIGAMAGISKEQYEAARVDGATPWQQFRYVTLPWLKPTLVVATLLKLISSIKIFDQVVTMTGGGPGRATETMSFFVYAQGFRYLDMGYASAVAWILVVALMGLAFVYIRYLTAQRG